MHWTHLQQPEKEANVTILQTRTNVMLLYFETIKH